MTYLSSLPPTLAGVTGELTDDMKHLVTTAKELFIKSYIDCCTTNVDYSNDKCNNTIKHHHRDHHHHHPAWIVTAPGCINIIGDHTDYTGGYVLPIAVQYSTVCYGTGYLHTSTSTSTAATQINIRIVKRFTDDHNNDSNVVYEKHISCSATSGDLIPPLPPSESSEPSPSPLSLCNNCIVGTIIQYIPDLPKEGCVVDLMLSYSSNIPLQYELSYLSSIEVSTALFMECILQDLAYSSIPIPPAMTTSKTTTIGKDSSHMKSFHRAVRCHRAENEWAYNPCTLMNQLASSCSIDRHAMLLDCTTMILTHIPLKLDAQDDPVFVICHSGISNNSSSNTSSAAAANIDIDIDIDTECGIRRKECHDAVDAIQSVPLYHVETLRDATVADVETAYEKNKLDDILYKRAMHVVTENRRVVECKTALKLGLWDKVGTLMNQSHDSLRYNYNVSCDPIDFLVQVARNCTVPLRFPEVSTTEPNINDDDQPQQTPSDDDTTATKPLNDSATTTTSTTIQNKHVVYGSRMTGSGFGGCTISLVSKQYANTLINELQSQYLASKYNNTCVTKSTTCHCYIVVPSSGARILAVDVM